MSDTVIKIENLGKKYKLGQRGASYATLRDTLSGLLNPLKPKTENPKPAPSETELWALKDINLEINRGEVVGVIGRNGAGKSTLLKILSRITEPTNGRVELSGRVGSLLEVGTGFHPELTGRENIFLNGSIIGMRRKEIIEKFDKIIEFAEIEKFIDTPVKFYSSGMYVRLAFAVAAHLEPEILLVDEVLAVGDIQFQKKCLGKMHDVAGQGRTVLFVSHNMGQIKKLCHRTILLENGCVKKDGEAEEIVDSYIESGIENLHEIKSENGFIVVGDKVNIVSAAIYGERKELVPQTGKKIHIDIEILFKQRVRNPAAKVLIRSLQGDLISYLTSTPYGGNSIEWGEGKYIYKLEIEKFMLTGGTFSLSLGVNMPGQENYIEDTEVCLFDVASVDYYNSGIMLHHSNAGIVASDHKWSIVQI